MKIALQRWYDVIQTGQTIELDGAKGAAFDGNHIWTTQRDNVLKVQSSDGQVATFLTSRSTQCLGANLLGAIAFDGIYVWVAATDVFSSTCLMKIRAGDGTVVESVPIGPLALGIAFDGTSIWTAGEGYLVKIRASDASILVNIDVPRRLAGVTFDGTSIWAGDDGHILLKIDPASGAIVQEVQVPIFGLRRVERGIAFDGDNVWVANGQADSVTKVRASDGAILGTFPVGRGATGLVFDGTHIWVANSDSCEPFSPSQHCTGSTVTRLRADDGSVVGTFNAGPGVIGLAFDGRNIWAAFTGDFDPTTRTGTRGGLAKF